MNYHNITKDDMLNGNDLGVVLWVAGCSHRCPSCQNPETWSVSSGIPFDDAAIKEIFDNLDHDYIKRLTLSGGDPMHKNNVSELVKLITKVRDKYDNAKEIWVYTGYTLEQLIENKDSDEAFRNRFKLLNLCDVLVDGRFYKNLADIKYPWAGSTNQRVIDLRETFRRNEVILFTTERVADPVDFQSTSCCLN